MLKYTILYAQEIAGLSIQIEATHNTAQHSTAHGSLYSSHHTFTLLESASALLVVVTVLVEPSFKSI